MTAAALRRPGLRGLVGSCLDLLLPPGCPRCEAAVPEPGLLCASCWASVTFLSEPCCACCGAPFELAGLALPEATLCGACLARRPPYGRARSALAYDEASQGPILAFKHADRSELAATFAGWMARAGAELLRDAEILAPVPLHRWRLLSRRYNQAALLASALSRRAARPVIQDLLLRRRATASQGHRSRAQRRRNVAGAFEVNPRRRGELAGRRVLLVDDVLTSGATVEACARTLLAGGAACVDVLTLARVERPRG